MLKILGIDVAPEILCGLSLVYTPNLINLHLPYHEINHP